MPHFVDLTDQRFGLLAVYSYAGFLDNRHRWICRCDCGQWRIYTSDRAKEKTSCGCDGRKKRLAANTIHGYATNGRQKAEYSCYYNMLRRCTNPKDIGYADYGGRGIQVCTRWRYGDLKGSGFECFIADLGSRPTNNHTLEREDFNGNYEPNNVSWQPKEVQQSNTRRNVFVVIAGKRMTLQVAHKLTGFSRCKVDFWRAKGMTVQEVFDKLYDGTYRKTERPTKEITFRGETMNLYAWSKKLNMRYSLLKQRLANGWSVERALSEPPDPKKSHAAKRQDVSVVTYDA